MKKWKVCWGIVPLAINLALILTAWLLDTFADLTLRSLPCLVLTWSAFFAVLLFIFWLGYYGGKQILQKIKGPVMRMLWQTVPVVLFALLSFAAIGIMLFCSAFIFRPEHVVEQNGIRMVASINSFLQEHVYYHEYVNPLFYGKETIGYEYYGRGGGDPLERGDEPVYWYFEDPDGNVIESGSAEGGY